MEYENDLYNLIETMEKEDNVSLPHDCLQCGGPAQHMLFRTHCITLNCPNYSASTAKKFWARFGNAALDLSWEDPWDDNTTLPGLK